VVYDSIITHPNSSLIYLEEVPYSAMFYSQGKAKLQDQHLLSSQDKMFIAVNKKDMHRAEELIGQFKQTKEYCSIILLESMDKK
jgi:hypothetical protein